MAMRKKSQSIHGRMDRVKHVPSSLQPAITRTRPQTAKIAKQPQQFIFMPEKMMQTPQLVPGIKAKQLGRSCVNMMKKNKSERQRSGKINTYFAKQPHAEILTQSLDTDQS